MSGHSEKSRGNWLGTGEGGNALWPAAKGWRARQLAAERAERVLRPVGDGERHAVDALVVLRRT